MGNNNIACISKREKNTNLSKSNTPPSEASRRVTVPNVNVIMDNWLTSVEIADNLLDDKSKLTLIGTLRKYMRKITPEMISTKGRETNTSISCFTRDKTMISHSSKKNKMFLLLSTMHEGGDISVTNNKPEIV